MSPARLMGIRLIFSMASWSVFAGRLAIGFSCEGGLVRIVGGGGIDHSAVGPLWRETFARAAEFRFKPPNCVSGGRFAFQGAEIRFRRVKIVSKGQSVAKPGIGFKSHRVARNYISIARNWEQVSGAENMQEALRILAREDEDDTSQSSPAAVMTDGDSKSLGQGSTSSAASHHPEAKTRKVIRTTSFASVWNAVQKLSDADMRKLVERLLKRLGE